MAAVVGYVLSRVGVDSVDVLNLTGEAYETIRTMEPPPSRTQYIEP